MTESQIIAIGVSVMLACMGLADAAPVICNAIANAVIRIIEAWRGGKRRIGF